MDSHKFYRFLSVRRPGIPASCVKRIREENVGAAKAVRAPL